MLTKLYVSLQMSSGRSSHPFIHSLTQLFIHSLSPSFIIHLLDLSC